MPKSFSFRKKRIHSEGEIPDGGSASLVKNVGIKALGL